MNLAEVRDCLDRFVAAEISDYRVGEVTESDGHAGLTFLFDIHQLDGQADPRQFVLKVPPRGVKLRGNTDVYRQAPLLRALHAAGQLVPSVPWAFEENPWFELPFIVMERLPGRVFFVWSPHASFPRDKAYAQGVWRQCLELLPPLHEFDWQRDLGDWEAPQDLVHLIDRWERIYAQALDPEWVAAGARVQRLLHEVLPDPEPLGLFHGDYQPGNLLYDGRRCTGIIDWELAGIGPQLLDVGWMMLVGDHANWTGVPHPPVYPLDPAEIRTTYEQARGRKFRAIPWFQAYAGYRLGSIACLNIKLHRKGQRPDPFWEHLEGAVIPMFDRAETLLREWHASG